MRAVAFLSSSQRVLTRDQLLDVSRLHNAEVYDRTIDAQILRRRRKIEADPSIRSSSPLSAVPATCSRRW
jgi:DNA-binding response OmpR family regulator